MKMFIYCAGGFGKEVYDVASRFNRQAERWDELLFIDDYQEAGAACYGTKVYPFSAVLERFDPAEIQIVIANGEPAHRQTLYERVTSSAIPLGQVVDLTSVVADTAQLAEGVIVTPLCSISSLARLDDNVSVNTMTIIGHDVHVGRHSVVSSMVNLGGGCVIGENSYIGMGAQIKEGVTIGKDVIIGMGSIVFNDIPDGVIALGNPARPMRPNVDKRVFKKGS